MIYFVTLERFDSPIRRLMRGLTPELRGVLKSLSYEELFFERGGPVGHYVFTDFDRLSRYELDCVAGFAAALGSAAPEARILNHPLRVLERFPLLIALHKAGLNDFTAVRLDSGERPDRYPVFIRAEDGYEGPETDLICDDSAFEAALACRARDGPTLKGRIAVGYAAERSPDGYFRKYGAFNVAGRIIPYHLMRGDSWIVKRHAAESEYAMPLDVDLEQSAPAVMEELAYVRDNPHRETLEHAFAIAGIDYGRADYGVVDGRVQIYEINTNPTHSRFRMDDNRSERRRIIRDRMIETLSTLDTAIRSCSRIRFSEPRPRAHNLHWPRWRLPQSLARRAADVFSGVWMHRRDP